MRFTVSTSQSQEVVNITDRINSSLGDLEANEGVVHITVLHTTAALTTADLDPGTDKDMLDAFREMIPDLDYRHPHNPDHVDDHILSTLIGPTITLPVEGGKLMLGTWQEVVLFEFNGPRDRELVLNFKSL
ncbi:MAG: secondary thiamine-phosphate synthase enzyme YjbQ [Candidatus Magasanikbacteria bacterium]